MPKAAHEAMHLETAFMRTFVLPSRRSRYLSLLNTRSGRDKIRRSFLHFRDFNPHCINPIPSAAQTVDIIEGMLRQRGAPAECYVWSAVSGLDGSWTELRNALMNVLGLEPGTVLICAPDKLAYYEGEEKNDRFILSRDV